jgi:hypothetical protein
MARNAWEKLIAHYADGKPICNCRDAYYTPNEEGNLVCRYGCSTAKLHAKQYVAERVNQDLKRLQELEETESAQYVIETCTTCNGRGKYQMSTFKRTVFTRKCAQCSGTGVRIVGPKLED